MSASDIAIVVAAMIGLVGALAKLVQARRAGHSPELMPEAEPAPDPTNARERLAEKRRMDAFARRTAWGLMVGAPSMVAGMGLLSKGGNAPADEWLGLAGTTWFAIGFGCFVVGMVAVMAGYLCPGCRRLVMKPGARYLQLSPTHCPRCGVRLTPDG